MPSLLTKDYRVLALAAVVISLLLSAWSVYADNVINNDGIEYLRMAASLQLGDWVSAMKQYKWPFYSLLIAYGSHFTGLSLEYTAYTINAVMYALMVLAFMALVLEVSAERKTLIAAAATILLFPALNDYRAYTIRDPGYIAFYLISILYFVKLYRAPSFSRGVLSLGAICIAALFRIEGIIFLLVMPILLALRSAESKAQRIIVVSCAVIALIIIIAGFGWWFFKPNPQLGHLAMLDNPWAVLMNAWQEVSGDMEQKLILIRSELLGRYSAGYSYAVMIFIVLTIIFTEVVTELGIVYLILLIYALRKRHLFEEKRIKTIWYMFVGINVAILFNFVLFRYFLTPRYSLTLVTTLLIPIPFGLVVLYDQWQERRRDKKRFNWKFPTAAVLLLIAGIEGLGVFTEKQHIKEAGLWVSNNTPVEARIYTNDKILAYYTNRQATVDNYIDDPSVLINKLYHAWWSNQYLVMRVKRKGVINEQFITDYFGNTPPVTRFVSEKGDVVLIYATGVPPQ